MGEVKWYKINPKDSHSTSGLIVLDCVSQGEFRNVYEGIYTKGDIGLPAKLVSVSADAFVPVDVARQ